MPDAVDQNGDGKEAGQRLVIVSTANAGSNLWASTSISDDFKTAPNG
jgi:hypothetical protein